MSIISEALKYYGRRLTEFERQEIQEYAEVWYLGLGVCKINGVEGLTQNGGYDDDNGSYNKVILFLFFCDWWLHCNF